MYGAVGENSIDFPWIPYRLFPDTSVQPLGQHGSNEMFVWDKHSVPIAQPLPSSVEKSAKVRYGGCIGAEE